MSVCQLLSGLCCAMWYEQRTLLQSAHLSVQVKVTFTAADLLEQKQTHELNVFSYQHLKKQTYIHFYLNFSELLTLITKTVL